MKYIIQALEAIRADIEGTMPSVLDEHGKPKHFEEYLIGYPVDDKKILLCVRAAEGSNKTSEKSLVFNIHAQLPGVTETGAYSYMDAVNDYLDNVFDPKLAGYTDYSYSFAMTDNFRTSTIEAFWDVSLTLSKDDCDF